MTINQIDSAPSIDKKSFKVQHGSGGGEKEDAFEQVLASAKDPEAFPVAIADAETTAQLLRLQMLRSAVSLADSDSPSDALPTTVFIKKALAVFAEQTPSQQTPGELPQAAAGMTIPATLSEGSQSIETIFTRASGRYGVDAGLIKAVIKAESNFNVRAVSPAGARGLMQLMPATAKGLGVTDSFDAEQNIMAGTRFLKDMLNRYGGDLNSALAAYNWGPGNVDRRGASLPRETREYLVKVKRFYQDYTA